MRMGQCDEIRSIGPSLGFQRQWAVVDASLSQRLTGEGIHRVLRIVQIMIPVELNAVGTGIGERHRFQIVWTLQYGRGEGLVSEFLDDVGAASGVRGTVERNINRARIWIDCHIADALIETRKVLVFTGNAQPIFRKVQDTQSLVLRANRQRKAKHCAAIPEWLRGCSTQCH